MESEDSRACPFCGEAIKKVAIRCKHCHAGLASAEPDFNRGAPSAADDFEGRFLEFAYATTGPLDALSVAHALKVPIRTAEERLEDLAASDRLVRMVDDEGHVTFRLPGRNQPQALVKMAAGQPLFPIAAPPPPQAMMGLVLNLVVPGVGSIVAGKTVEGIAQFVLLMVGLPLCFILIGIPICIATWGWALSTGLRAVQEAQQAQQKNQGS